MDWPEPFKTGEVGSGFSYLDMVSKWVIKEMDETRKDNSFFQVSFVLLGDGVADGKKLVYKVIDNALTDDIKARAFRGRKDSYEEAIITLSVVRKLYGLLDVVTRSSTGLTLGSKYETNLGSGMPHTLAFLQCG